MINGLITGTYVRVTKIVGSYLSKIGMDAHKLICSRKTSYIMYYLLNIKHYVYIILYTNIILSYRKAVPRNILAYFHSSGIDEFKDDRGNSFPTRDPPALAVCQDTPPSHTTVRNFREDQISEPHQIAIQLLGYEQ